MLLRRKLEGVSTKRLTRVINSKVTLSVPNTAGPPLRPAPFSLSASVLYLALLLQQQVEPCSLQHGELVADSVEAP